MQATGRANNPLPSSSGTQLGNYLKQLTGLTSDPAQLRAVLPSTAVVELHSPHISMIEITMTPPSGVRELNARPARFLSTRDTRAINLTTTNPHDRQSQQVKHRYLASRPKPPSHRRDVTTPNLRHRRSNQCRAGSGSACAGTVLGSHDGYALALPCAAKHHATHMFHHIAWARLQAALITCIWLVTGSCNVPPTESAGAQIGITVIETMDSGGYTYVKLNSTEGGVWYAVPECHVSVGDRVEEIDRSGSVEMHDFESKTLQRTFPKIIFAGSLKTIQLADG